MRTSLLISSFASAVTLAATPAFADELEPSVEAPAFTSLDRSAQGNHTGADLSFIFLGGVDGEASPGAVSRLDLHGAYVGEHGFGAYGSLAISKTFLDEDADVEMSLINEQNAMSSLEVGGIYQRALSRRFDLGVHLGVTLPTADDDFGAVTNLLSSFGRINDLVLAAPDSVWLRFGATPTYHHENLFVRADVGVDVGLDLDDQTGHDPIGHANIGVGYAAGRFAASAELVTMIDIPEVGNNSLMHAATLSGEYRAGRVTPSLAVTTLRDDLTGGDSVSVMLGIKAGL